MPLPIAAAAGAAMRGARGATAQQSRWQLDLAKRRSADANQETEPEEEEISAATLAAMPIGAMLKQGTGGDGLFGTLKSMFALGIGAGSFILLRGLFALGLPTWGFTFIFYLIYTVIYDFIFVFGWNKSQSGLLSKLTEPADALNLLASQAGILDLPDWMKTMPRLMFRVFGIYPIGFIVSVFWGIIISLIVLITWGAFHPIEAMKTFGAVIFESLSK